MTFVKGVSGNPSGRPRRDPLSDPSVLLAVERCLTWPLDRQPKTRAEVLALRVIKRASHGSLKPILEVQERLRDYRKLKSLQLAKPWDYGGSDGDTPEPGDTGDSGETSAEQASDPLFPVSASTHENAHPEPITRQNTQQGAEQDAWTRLEMIRAQAQPMTEQPVFGQAPKPEPYLVDERYDPLKGPLDAHKLWEIMHTPAPSYRAIEREPEPPPRRTETAPYRIGIPGEQR